MNLIVTNKYKDLIYNTNIEVLKELNGVFKVSQIANSFKSIFYKKIIIDGTALENFPRENVLRELITTFDADKLILFLPPDNPPPKKFLSFLISIGLYNFTDNPNGLVELTKKSNTKEDVAGFLEPVRETSDDSIIKDDLYDNNDAPGRIVVGFKSVTENSYVTELIYGLKRTLEDKYKKDVMAIEINKRDFMYYNQPHMYSISGDKLNEFLKNNLNWDVVLVDLNDFNDGSINDLIYLVNPSLFTTNKLLYKQRDALIKLKGEKVVFVNSLLNTNDVNGYAKEAGISVYFNLPPVNDRVHSDVLDKFLVKLGIVEGEVKNVRKGILDLFR